MNIPKEFDAIRPWEPEDLPDVYDRLLADEQFQQIVSSLFPQVPKEVMANKLHSCRTSLDFQLAFIYDFVKNLMSKASLGFDMDSSLLDHTRNYTFISNHRDIVLDSALLDVMLVDAKFTTTCEIAMGDNLLKAPWIKDLARLNKAFLVERGLPMRQMLMASKRLSEYMHFSIREKKENIWIAQREGRAKDSNDRTQEAILKMMVMGGQGSIIDRLVDLHLVPLSISYEFDPCDFLKAKEFQQKRDIEGWNKGPTDDLVSMQTGLMGYKGHVYYHCSSCLDEYLRTLDPSMPKAELFKMIAEHIDKEIHLHYYFYPCNYVAYDELNGLTTFSDKYTAEQKNQFDQYLDGQLIKIDLEHKDDDFLRERMLTMYSYPLKNYLEAMK
jgi:hypothetical protein